RADPGHRAAGRAHQPRHARDRAPRAVLAFLGAYGGREVRTVKSLAYIVGLPLILLALWYLATAFGERNFFVPTPALLAETFVDTWTWDRMTTDVFPSLSRLFVGIVGSILIGIIGGLLIGSIRWLRALLEPTLEFFRAIPPTVLIPVLMLL